MEAYSHMPDRDPNGRAFIISIGSRVQAHPACDCWMAGDRFGTVVKITARLIHVRMDRSGKVRKFTPSLLDRA
jgi:hypothetical protein